MQATFGLGSRERLPDGLRRQVGQDVAEARRALDGSLGVSLAAHEARKTIKRARALVRFARSSLGSDDFERANRTLRDAGRSPGPVRDSDVLVTTSTTLRQCGGAPELDSAWAILIDELEARRRALFASALTPEGAFAQARKRLDAVEIDWPASADFDDRELLRTGLTSSFRAARRGAARAFAGTDAHAHHELRKRTKDLRHQLEFLAPIAPHALGPMVEELHRLSDLLGNANDRVVLASHLEATSGIPDDPRVELIALLVGGRDALWREAASLGEHVFAEGTSEFVARVERYWVEARPQG